MSSLDLVIAVVVVAYAVSGYLQGFVVNLVATAGLVLGGLGAIWVVPHLLDRQNGTLTTSLLALGLVIGAAAIGQAIGTYIGTDLRGGLTAGPLRTGDADVVESVPVGQVAQLDEDLVIEVPMPRTNTLYLNTTKGPFKDPAVRAAAREAIDQLLARVA